MHISLCLILQLHKILDKDNVLTRPRALTKVKHTMGPTKGLQGGKLVFTVVGVARYGRRQVWASPGMGIAKYGRRHLWASPGMGVARFRRRPP